MAQYQGDPQVRQIYQILEQRLRELDLQFQGDLFYPVRAYLNCPIITLTRLRWSQRGSTTTPSIAAWKP
jgi:hypothetical protein